MSNQAPEPVMSETFTGKPVSQSPVGRGSPPLSTEPTRQESTKNDNG